MLNETRGSWVGPSAAGNAIYVSQLARFIEFVSRMEPRHWSVATMAFQANRSAIEQVHGDALEKAQAHRRSGGYPAVVLAAQIADRYQARLPVAATGWAIAARDLITPRQFATAFAPFSKSIAVDHLAPEILASPNDPRPYGPNGREVVQFLSALKTVFPPSWARWKQLASSPEHLMEIGEAADRAQATAKRWSRKMTAEIARSVTTEAVISAAMAWLQVNERVALAMFNCKSLASMAAAAIVLKDLLAPEDFETLIGPFADMLQ